MAKKNKILSGIAGAIATVGLLAATTGTAQAAPAPTVVTAQAQATAQASGTQTIKVKKGSKTATINPSTKGVPAGAKVTSKKVMVKKGKKTVAKNKSSYKAKKGTYKVTSTVKYQPKVTKTVSPNDVWAECRVTSQTITSDRTERRDWYDGTSYYAGQVTVAYTGTCTDRIWIDGTLKQFTWNTAWTDEDYVFTDDLYRGATDTEILNAKLADLYYGIGDVDYVDGYDMSKLPTYTAYGPTKTLTSTQAVKVVK